jgi:hypothetical protein
MTRVVRNRYASPGNQEGDGMKYLLIVVGLIIVVAAAVYFVPVKDGKTLVEAGTFDRFLKSAGVSSQEASSDGQVTMYRWRDQYGNWRYGDVPPKGVDAEPITVGEVETADPDTM